MCSRSAFGPAALPVEPNLQDAPAPSLRLVGGYRIGVVDVRYGLPDGPAVRGPAALPDGCLGDGDDAAATARAALEAPARPGRWREPPGAVRPVPDRDQLTLGRRAPGQQPWPGFGGPARPDDPPGAALRRVGLPDGGGGRDGLPDAVAAVGLTPAPPFGALVAVVPGIR